MWLSELVALVAPPLCWECGESVLGDGPLCSRCRRRLRWLSAEPARLHGLEIWAPLAYEGPARALVHGLKYRGAAALAETMAAQIAAAAPASLFATAALVPVPLVPSRARRRGFNQSTLLAAALARRTGRPVRDCLERVGSPTPQVGRARGARLAGVTGSAALADGAAAPGAALLVDDVVTTGATLAACARALRTAGALEVAAVAYARTPAR